MSYIEKAKQNAVNVQKAVAFDDMQKRLREQDLYDLGGKDAYMAVEQELVRRAASNQYPNRQGLATSLAL